MFLVVVQTFFPAPPQLSSDDVSASLGEESLQEDREEEPQETQQAPHPAGESSAIDFTLHVLFRVMYKTLNGVLFLIFRDCSEACWLLHPPLHGRSG